jgi:WD40 repeat protein/energy-coupling factor transporter ATP-binding protein EcfA2
MPIDGRRTETRLPYPGLRAFRRDETDIFFGREQHVDHLLGHLSDSRFLSVVGSSGCGKSSLIRAGLIPSLEGGFVPKIGSAWHVAEMRPGIHPIKRLAESVYAAITPAETTGNSSHDGLGIFQAMVRRGPRGLIDGLEGAPALHKANLLIYIDQFEELFRYRKEGNINEAEAFIALLLTSCEQQKVPVYIMLSMRSEFFGNCDYFQGLPEKINDCQYLVPRLTREQAREAIVGPARVFSGDVAPDLINTVLNDMGSEPDQLPLMQHFMMRVWLEKTRGSNGTCDRCLTCSDAAKVGGFSKALSLHADEAYDSLDTDGKKIAEVVFQCLSDHNLEKVDVRRPVELRSIAEVANADCSRVQRVIDVFRQPDKSFLVPGVTEPLNPDTVIDISHESLIRQWDRMRQWVLDESKSADMYREIEKTALKWKKGQAALWGSPELQNALSWKKEKNPSESWARRYGRQFEPAMTFLETSRKAYEKKKRNNKLMWVAIPLGIVAALTFVLLFMVNANHKLSTLNKSIELKNKSIVLQRDSLSTLNKSIALQRDNLEKLNMAFKSQSDSLAQVTGNLSFANANLVAESQSRQRADANALHEKRGKDSLIAIEAALKKSIDLAGSAVGLVGKREARLAGLMAWTSFTLYSKIHKDQIDERIYNALREACNLLDSNKVPRILPCKRSIQAMSFSKKKPNIFAIGYEDNDITLWSTLGESYKKIKSIAFSGSNTMLQSLSLSGDGAFLSMGYLDGMLLIEQTDKRKEVPTILGKHTGSVMAVSFSHNDSLLISGYEDGIVNIWKNGPGSTWNHAPATIFKTGKRLYALSCNPDRNVVAIGLENGELQLWNFDNGREKQISSKREHAGKVTSLGFSPDGAILVSGDEHGGIYFWQVSDSLDIRHIVLRHNSAISSVAFNGSGRFVATGSHDNTVIIWQLVSESIEDVLILKHNAQVTGVMFAPQEDVLIVSTMDSKMYYWDIQPSILANRLKHIIKNYFTQIEWKAYVGKNKTVVSPEDGAASNNSEYLDSSTGLLDFKRMHAAFMQK